MSQLPFGFLRRAVHPFSGTFEAIAASTSSFVQEEERATTREKAGGRKRWVERTIGRLSGASMVSKSCIMHILSVSMLHFTAHEVTRMDGEPEPKKMTSLLPNENVRVRAECTTRRSGDSVMRFAA